MTLHDLQLRFSNHLLDRPCDVVEDLGRDGAAGLAVYHNAYRAQLVACLRDTFERVWAWLGDDDFEVAARTHITANPPRTWTLADYGGDFSETLAALYPQHFECRELAALDWQLRRAFDGQDSDAVDISSLGEVDWDHAVLRFVPTLRILPARTNCCVIWTALANGETPPRAEWLPSPVAIRVWRAGLVPRFCTIDAVEQRAITLVQDGASFAAVCNALAEGRDSAAVVEDAGRLLAAWLRDGMVAAIDT